METIINNLPEYKTNQVLTETSLNATSDFLEQQERLTRFGLTQTGIIENLEYRTDQQNITVQEGFGVTTDGFFMAHHYKKGRKAYSFIKPYQFTNTESETVQLLSDLKKDLFSDSDEESPQTFPNVKFYELFTDEEAKLQTGTMAINQLDSSSYKIVLFLEILSKNKDQCSPTSCDSGGNMKEYRVVPMLVTDPQNQYFPIINCEKDLKNQVRLKRFSNLYQIIKAYNELTAPQKLAKPFYKTLMNEYSRLNTQNTITLTNKIDEILNWKYPVSLGKYFPSKNLQALKDARAVLQTIKLQYIPKVYKQDYPYNYGYVSQLDPISKIPKATRNFLKHTKLPRNFSLQASQSGVKAEAQLYYQYYLDFCNDLQMAINEFIMVYNNYIQKHYSSYDLRVQRFLVLGRNDKYDHDQFRYYAIQNFANQSYRDHKERIFKYMNRIPVLIHKFKTGFLQIRYKKEVRFIPSRNGNELLENRAIPFYYQQDLELEKAWAVSTAKTLSADIYQYRDLNDPYSHFIYNINDYNFIRIEGDVNAQMTTGAATGSAFPSMTKNIKMYNIPLSFTTMNIDQLQNIEEVMFWEHSGGIKKGGKYIFLVAKVNGQNKIIADFELIK